MNITLRTIALAFMAFICAPSHAATETEEASIKEYTARLIASMPSDLGLDNDEYFALLVQTAQAHLQDGTAALAELTFQRALSIGEEIYGVNSLQLRAPLLGLGDVYASREMTGEAAELWRRSLNIAEQELGKGNLSLREELTRLSEVDGARKLEFASRTAALNERAQLDGTIIPQGPTIGTDSEICPAREDGHGVERRDVFYATARVRGNLEVPSKAYENRYDADGGPYYGVVEVTLPCDRDLGEIPRPSFIKLEFRAKRGTHVVLENIRELSDEDEFWSRARDEMMATTRQEALVFVHGFSVSFEGAALRTAQLASDLEIDGIAFFYDWPSRANLFRYNTDREVATSEPIAREMAEFLKGVAEQTGAERINVIAHSMGNEPLLRGLRVLSQGGYDEPLFDEVVFASADVAIANFEAILGETRDLAKNMTSYASGGDWALSYAGSRVDFLRAGHVNERTSVDGVTTVDTTAVGSGFIGHWDYAGLDDLRSVLWFSAPPSARCVLSAKSAPWDWLHQPACEEAVFKRAVLLLRARGYQTAMRDLEHTAAFYRTDTELSESERREKLQRTEAVRNEIIRLCPSTRLCEIGPLTVPMEVGQ